VNADYSADADFALDAAVDEDLDAELDEELDAEEEAEEEAGVVTATPWAKTAYMFCRGSYTLREKSNAKPATSNGCRQGRCRQGRHALSLLTCFTDSGSTRVFRPTSEF
jgi:hypothetical protein